MKALRLLQGLGFSVEGANDVQTSHKLGCHLEVQCIDNLLVTVPVPKSMKPKSPNRVRAALSKCILVAFILVVEPSKIMFLI